MEPQQPRPDPKTLGIPNICFSIIDDDSKRAPEFAEQRRTRGFDDSELWSLDSTIAAFILPRLRRFKEIAHGHPGQITPEEWDGILDKMILAFERVAGQFELGATRDQERQYSEEIEEGMKLFAEWFSSLWN